MNQTSEKPYSLTIDRREKAVITGVTVSEEVPQRLPSLTTFHLRPSGITTSQVP